MTFIIIFIFLIILAFQISEYKMNVKTLKSDAIMETRFSRYNRMTISSLRSLCKEKGYKKYTHFKKKDLIEFIMNQPEDVKNSLRDNIQKQEKSRSAVEFNGMELVCALLILNPKIRTFKQLGEVFHDELSDKLVFNKAKDFKEYVDDIIKKEKMVVEYMQNFRAYIRLWISKPIEKIFLSGKHNTHEEIEKLNEGSCKLEAKSDLYIKFTDGSFYGLSVKQSKDCTKSNYSVQKILHDLQKNDIDKELTTIKKKYLKQNGFDKFRKSRRKEVNELFYPQNKDNPYMNKLREELNKNGDYIGKYLVQKLYATSISYNIYEFNGEELIKLKSFRDMDVSFYEHKPYYYDKKGNERETAKLFYRLVTVDRLCNEEKIYRIEVRWKGNVHDSSPQFQIHEE